MRPLVADIFHVLKDAEQGGYFMSTPEIHRELCRSDPDPRRQDSFAHIAAVA